MALSENLNPRVKVENESGKSRRFLSFISSILTYLKYDRLAKFGGVGFSDTPNMGLLRNSSCVSGADQEWSGIV